ncbi:MAG: hypothetical protein ACJ766_01090 [Thermoleophilaceae bacterium]|jgi:DNA-directed RNA polymerase subunit RPC12/RpoP
MRPIGWTAQHMRGRCEVCDEEVALSWETYFDAIEYGRTVACSECGARQPMRDRRQHREPVSLDRRHS